MAVTENERASGRGDRRLLGLLLLIGGGIWLLNETGLAMVGATTALSLILIVLGLGMMLLRPSHSRGALVLGGIVIACILIFSPASISTSGLGDFVERPATQQQLDEGFSLVAGSLMVDLTEIEDWSSRPDLSVRVAFGEVTVLVPSDITFTLRAQGIAGEVIVDGETLEEGLGFDASRRFGLARRPDLNLDVEVAFGSITVEHE